jgi:hypothetical protein
VGLLGKYLACFHAEGMNYDIVKHAGFRLWLIHGPIFQRFTRQIITEAKERTH